MPQLAVGRDSVRPKELIRQRERAAAPLPPGATRTPSIDDAAPLAPPDQSHSSVK